jgi:Ca2+-transporting ATPase
VGLEPGRPVTGSDLERVDEREASALLRAAPIVARVLPATKVALVRAHREAGEIVAMTGDGVNDAPALRAADIGVALAGDGGTDVAREAAGLVVTSGDLGVIVAAVREGRRIYRNVANVVAYLLTGNLSEILVVAGALAVVPELSVPLLPVQLLWLNLVSDGLPALALGVDSDVADPLLGPPRRRDDRLLGGRRLGQLCLRAAVMATAVIGATVWARDRGWTDAEIRSELLLALLVTHVVFAYVTRSTSHVFERAWWRSRTLALAVSGSLAVQLPLYLTAPGRSMLRLGVLPAAGWLVALAAALTAVAVVDVGRTVARHWRTS